MAELKAFEKDFESLTLGRPLLTTVEDYEETVDIVMKEMPKLKKRSLMFSICWITRPSMD